MTSADAPEVESNAVIQLEHDEYEARFDGVGGHEGHIKIGLVAR